MNTIRYFKATTLELTGLRMCVGVPSRDA